MLESKSIINQIESRCFRWYWKSSRGKLKLKSKMQDQIKIVFFSKVKIIVKMACHTYDTLPQTNMNSYQLWCDIFSRKRHGRKEQFHVAKVHYSHEWKGWNMKEVSRPSSSSPSSPPSSPSSPPSSASGAAICFLSSQPTLLEINLLYHLSSFSLIPASLVEEDGEAAADKVQHRLTQIMFYIFYHLLLSVSQWVSDW